AGSTGVEFFFILSGYLAYQSLDRICEQDRKRGAINWWKKRAVRILPLYYVVILFYAVYFSGMGNVPVDETGLGWIRYVLLLNQWIPSAENFWVNLGAVWTISVFVFFYLIVPVYHRFIRSYRGSLAGIAVLYILARLVERSTDWLRPLQFLYLFAIGITVYLAVKEKKEWNFTALVIPILLLLSVKGSDSGILSAFLAAIFIAASSTVRMEWPFITKTANVISAYSYSAYLIHACVVEVMTTHRPDSDVLYVLIFTAATLIVTWFAYQLVEKRFSRLLLRRGKSKPEGADS
ncbi:MAG: acyltransferase, partial [Lachnospiraceae bacterium]|nr:acyltransferase [Lachnospiraceae bacterium]